MDEEIYMKLSSLKYVIWLACLFMWVQGLLLGWALTNIFDFLKVG